MLGALDNNPPFILLTSPNYLTYIIHICIRLYSAPNIYQFPYCLLRLHSLSNMQYTKKVTHFNRSGVTASEQHDCSAYCLGWCASARSSSQHNEQNMETQGTVVFHPRGHLNLQPAVRASQRVGEVAIGTTAVTRKMVAKHARLVASIISYSPSSALEHAIPGVRLRRNEV